MVSPSTGSGLLSNSESAKVRSFNMCMVILCMELRLFCYVRMMAHWYLRYLQNKHVIPNYVIAELALRTTWL